PPGVKLDSGGLGKGLAADRAAARLPASIRYVIGLGGDLAVGGDWPVAVIGAFGGNEVHRLRVVRGGVATSGIATRIWSGPDGAPAHHLIDPVTGAPAWTGVVAATAVAPTALEAEVIAKAAALSGPRAARRLLRRRGGVLQYDSGHVEAIEPAPVVRLPRVAVA
ncbi:MAG: FAD:protein transferase, partial [Thermoleophilaceae bacterium]|nr:FAD:protein transferase [Thermoleophilaceae bacterium]